MLIHAHIFYHDLCVEILQYLQKVDINFDFFITSTSPIEENTLQKFSSIQFCNKVSQIIVPNIGRDVAPFIVEVLKLSDEYEYICHLHTKKSPHTFMGDYWRKYLLSSLFESDLKFSELIKLEHNLYYPPPHFLLCTFLLRTFMGKI